MADNVITPARVADPQGLTTSQLHREVATLEKAVNSKIESVEALFEVKVVEIHRIITVAHQDLVRVPTDVDKAVFNLQSFVAERIVGLVNMWGERHAGLVNTINEKLLAQLKYTDVKFESVKTQFDEREKQATQAAVSTSKAVDAALQATKDQSIETNKSNNLLIAKQETYTNEAIKALKEQFNTAFGGLNSKVDGVNERVGAIENFQKGQGSAEKKQDTNIGLIVSIVGVLLAILVAVASIIIKSR